MSGKRLNKSTRSERNQAISNGLTALPSKTTIPVHGRLMNANDAAKVFEGAAEAGRQVVSARARYKQALAEAHAADAAIGPLVQPIKSFVQNTFGERSEIAAAFGFEPRKIPRVSAEARYEAVERLRATRAARRAMTN